MENTGHLTDETIAAIGVAVANALQDHPLTITMDLEQVTRVDPLELRTPYPEGPTPLPPPSESPPVELPPER